MLTQTWTLWQHRPSGCRCRRWSGFTSALPHTLVLIPGAKQHTSCNFVEKGISHRLRAKFTD